MILYSAVFIQKGGQGKSNTTIHLAGALAEIDPKGLVVDLDPQGNLTEGLGMQDIYLQDDYSLYQSIVEGKGEATRLIQPLPHEKFHLLPSNYQMMLAERALYMERNREHKLKGILDPLREKYNWILIDCPPFFGNLTDNALNSARSIIIPVEAEPPTIRALELLFDQIESLERGLKIEIETLAVVPNKVQDSSLSKRILANLRASLPPVVPFEIRKRVILQEAFEQGRTIFSYDIPKGTSEERQRAGLREDDKRELKDLYSRLAQIVIEKAKEGRNNE